MLISVMFAPFHVFSEQTEPAGKRSRVWSMDDFHWLVGKPYRELRDRADARGV
jgi:hypothetical protein